MQKLINTYRVKPSLALAQKIRDYDLKHPFASCILTRDDGRVMNEAICFAVKES